MHKSPAFSTSFLESRMIQKLKSRKSRIKPGLFAFLLAERIIFGKKTHKTGENTGFSTVFFLHVLHGHLVHFGSDTWFSHLVLPVPNRSHPLQHPKRTRFRLFRAESGAFRSFDPQNFSHLFCSLCRHGSQVEFIGDPTQPGGALFDVVQLG